MIRISHTDIATFLRCRRRFYWSFVRDIHAPERLYGPLACGTRVHAAVQEYHQRGTDPRDSHQRLAERDEAILVSQDAPTWQMTEFYDDVILGRNCCIAYREWVESQGPYAEFDLQAEQILEAPNSGGLDVTLIGKVDLLLTRRSDGWICTDDLKTASVHTRTSLAFALEKSYQHVVYQVLAAVLHPDQIIGEAWYTVAYKVKAPARLIHPMIERFHVPGNVASIPHRRRQLESIIEDMLAFIERTSDGDDAAAYPVPADSCRWCEFRHPCSLRDEVPLGADAMLAEQFVRGGKHSRYDADADFAEPN